MLRKGNPILRRIFYLCRFLFMAEGKIFIINIILIGVNSQHALLSDIIWAKTIVMYVSSVLSRFRVIKINMLNRIR